MKRWFSRWVDGSPRNPIMWNSLVSHSHSWVLLVVVVTVDIWWLYPQSRQLAKLWSQTELYAQRCHLFSFVGRWVFPVLSVMRKVQNGHNRRGGVTQFPGVLGAISSAKFPALTAVTPQIQNTPNSYGILDGKNTKGTHFCSPKHTINMRFFLDLHTPWNSYYVLQFICFTGDPGTWGFQFPHSGAASNPTMKK